MNDADFDPSQVVISGCPDGVPMLLTTSWQEIHRGGESKSGEVWDVVTIEGSNVDGSTQSVSLGFGSEAVHMEKSMTTANGREPVVVKARIRRGTPIYALASANDAVWLYGEVGVLEAVETV